ncbi:alpha/beta hydrolase [Shewanella donghaensis]|uniref:alpha/beta hydrolase n=1 Tax=Shewanella donghaensis TaxID=238836 RepID=UPI0011830BE4|nr:alpha/beta hydrolase-fold protein [Shewanella donghaensis]
MTIFRCIVLIFSLFLSVASPAFASFIVPNTTMVEIEDSDRTYSLYIKLPNSYNQVDKLKHYPVIYMTDAMYSFQIVSGATRFPMNNAVMQQAILVGVSWQQGKSPAVSRIRDYTPSVDQSWKRSTGDAERHMQLFANKIIPYMNKHYRTQTAKNTFVGNSLGGLFGAYVLRTKPELFKNYVLGSPSLWFDHKQLLKQFRDQQYLSQVVNANVFIGIGELETAALTDFGHDMVLDAKDFQQLLQQKNRLSSGEGQGINTKLMVIPEANHSMAFPTTAIHGLSWLFDLKKGVVFN